MTSCSLTMEPQNLSNVQLVTMIIAMMTELAGRIGISLPLSSANGNSIQDDTPMSVHTPGSDHSFLFEAEGGTISPTPGAEPTPNSAGVAGENPMLTMDAGNSTVAPVVLDPSDTTNADVGDVGLETIEYDPFDRPPNEMLCTKRRKLDEQ